MARNLCKALVIRALVNTRTALNGRVRIAVAVDQASPTLSYGRCQQTGSPRDVLADGQGMLPDRLAMHDPRGTRAGRPAGLFGISGSRFATTAAGTVLSQEAREPASEPPTWRAERSARRATARRTGFASASWRIG
jgi:flagellar basal body rod protein FlgG